MSVRYERSQPRFRYREQAPGGYPTGEPPPPSRSTHQTGAWTLGNHHLDEAGGTVALFDVPSHKGESQCHGGSDVEGLGPSHTELASQPGRCPRENVVDGDEAKRGQAKDGIDGPARQSAPHLGQEQGRRDQQAALGDMSGQPTAARLVMHVMWHEADDDDAGIDDHQRSRRPSRTASAAERPLGQRSDRLAR